MISLCTWSADSTAPSYIERDWDEAWLLRECEDAKHVLNGATVVPLVMTTLGELSPSAEGCLET